MARIRTVKPEFFTSRVTSRLSYGARLTFIGLWTHSDDEGRSLAECRLLKASLWPLDDDVDSAQVLQWLGELSAVGLIVTYRSGPNNLIQVRNWAEHQRVNRPTLSRYPAPTDEEIAAAHALSDSSVSAHGGLIAGRERKGRERNREGNVAPAGANGNHPGSRPGTPATPLSWVDEARTIYQAIGDLPHARIGRALSQTVKEYGWEHEDRRPAVKRWFTAYVETRPYRKRDGSYHGDNPGDNPGNIPPRNTDFMSPEDFVKNLATWKERCAPLVKR